MSELDDEINAVLTKLERKGVFLSSYGNVAGTSSLMNGELDVYCSKTARELFDCERVIAARCTVHSLFEGVRSRKDGMEAAEVRAIFERVFKNNKRYEHFDGYISIGDAVMALMLENMHCSFNEEVGGTKKSRRVYPWCFVRRVTSENGQCTRKRRLTNQKRNDG